MRRQGSPECFSQPCLAFLLSLDSLEMSGGASIHANSTLASSQGKVSQTSLRTALYVPCHTYYEWKKETLVWRDGLEIHLFFPTWCPSKLPLLRFLVCS